MSVADLAVRVAADVDNFNQNLASVDDHLTAWGKKMQTLGGNLGDLGRGMTSIGKTLTVALAVPLAGLAAGLIKTGVEFKAFKQEAMQAFSVLLGSSEAAKEHMDDILAFARTTPFAFPDLVSANRKLVSFGMAAKDTHPVMDAIANAVAAMGGGAQEIEGMADIFARIESQGKITGRELNRMGEHGINAVAIMANKAGVSMDDMRKMISNSAVDSKTAIDWLVDGIMNGTEGIAGQTVALGGSLGALKDTWAGAMDSLRGAWRWTADAIVSDDMFAKIVEGIRKLTELVKDLPIILGPIAETVGDVFVKLLDGIGKLVDWFTNLDPGMQQFIIRLGLILVAAGPILLLIGGLITQIGSLITAVGTISAALGALGGAAVIGPVLAVIAAIAALAVIIVNLWRNSESFRDGVIAIWETIKATVAPLIDMIKENIGRMMEAAGPALETLKNAFLDLQPILEIVAAVLGTAWAVAAAIFTGVINGIINAIAPLVQAFGGLLSFVTNIVNAIIALFRGDFAGAWDYVKKAGQGFVDFLAGLVGTVIGFVSGLVEGIVGFFTSLYNALIGHSIIPDLVNGIINWIKQLPGKIIEIVKNMMTGFINGIKSRIGNITGAIGDAVTGIRNRIASLPGELLQAGRNMIGNLAQGIRDRIGSITGAIGDIAQKIRGFLPFSPAKEGPLRILPDFGDYFALGIEGAERDISRAMADVLGGFAPRAEIAFAGAGYTGGISSAPVRHEHSGRIVIEGVNSKGEFIDAVEVVLSGLDSPQVKRRIDEALYETRRSRLAPQGAY